MVKDLATVPVGSVIIAAVRDEGSRRLTKEAKDIFTSMGAKEINNLAYRVGYVFMGVKGSKSHIEKRGYSVNTGMILGYSRVTKREKHTKIITQTKSYKKSIRRVMRHVIRQRLPGGGIRTKVVTRVSRRTVTCKRTRKIKKTYYKVSSS